jgi:hypothetical protein
MSEAIWIAIATTIAMVITELVSFVSHARVAREIANPAQKPLKPTRNISGKLAYLMKRYVAPIVSLVLPVFGVVRELSRPEPLSKLSIFFIFLYSVAMSVSLSTILRTYSLESAVRSTRKVSSRGKKKSQVKSHSPDSKS